MATNLQQYKGHFMATSYKETEYKGKLGMVQRYAKGIHGQTACTYFAEVEAEDGRMVRMAGGQAPSAYTSTRGAAGAINRVLLDRAELGATWAELVQVVERTCLGKGGIVGKPTEKLVAHLRSFFLQADERRAQTNGLKHAVKANGWNWEQVKANALLIDGKPWNGEAIKRCVGAGSTIVPVVLLAVNYKATASLVKALNLTD
jgi:hypothetical protein